MNTSPPPAHDPVPARMGQLLGLPIASEVDVFDLVRTGLPAETWTYFAAAVPLPRDLFVRADYARLMVTLGRRFTAPETDLILRAVRLFAQAEETLGSRDAASEWLCAPLSLRPGQPEVAPWTLATTEAGARLCERLLGLGTAVAAPPATRAAPDIDVDALVRDEANMSAAELDWAAALEEQRAAGAAPAASGGGAAAEVDVDVDALIGEVAVDPHELDWAAALAEQAAAGSADTATVDDADAILAAVQANG